VITYHNAHLAPEPLLHLLPQLVDERYHVPVIFNTRGRGLLEGYHIDDGTERIEIHLHSIWWRSRKGMADLWRGLLDTCLHEFGHVATIPRLDPTVVSAYRDDSRARKYVELPAIAWRSAASVSCSRATPDSPSHQSSRVTSEPGTQR